MDLTSYSSVRVVFSKFPCFSEYGNDWHHAGSLANKQNVFDDFISAGEELCNLKYTSPSK